MVAGGRELVDRRVVEQVDGIPPRNKIHPERRQCRLQRSRLARKLVAKLHAFEARLARFGKANFQRRLPANFEQVVIGPADGIGADADGHELCPRWFLSFAALRSAHDPTAWMDCAPGSGPSVTQICFSIAALPRRASSTSLALGDFRHSDIPPMAARIGRGQRIGIDDDDARAIVLARTLEGATSRSPIPVTFSAIAPRLRHGRRNRSGGKRFVHACRAADC